MANRMIGTIVSGVVCGVALLGAAGVGWGQGAKALYPAMAPIEQYRVASVAEEVALARSAANVAVSGDAEVMVLGSHGYETAAKGKNGFVCLVERSWATTFDDPQFWNPKLRAPHCFNAAAARSVMPAYLKRTELVLSGMPKDQVEARMKEAVATKVIGAPEQGTMCYMMSKQGNLNDHDGHWRPHLMFFLPTTDAASWGANLDGSQVFAAQGNPEPVTIFMVPVTAWSDGTVGEMK
ncbi:hypothetical protein RBB79_06260 [Tunturiibacter empetritectus]|uniref:Uncharacterized protein n=1 Tax=Tunturiibacter lichenicola TaxID=2051959 RepID=A0A852VFW5_9BACT|nr:hypothetical protein [Edaphobacter lichenicola]NYF89135.1 hypothetical protein [Edaphobacter lichenicola]